MPRLTALKGAFPFADANSNSGTAPEMYLAACGRPLAPIFAEPRWRCGMPGYTKGATKIANVI